MNKQQKNFHRPLYKRSKFALPYPRSRIPVWCYRFIRGISKKNPCNLSYAPQQLVLNDIIPETSLCFIGDIMELKERNLHVGESVKDFVQGANYVIGNFEATITKENRIFMDQRHKEQILDALEALFDPQRTYLSLANNHTGDFGRKIFKKSLEKIQQRGFQIFGLKPRPYCDLEEKIRVIGGSMWSNRPCNYIINFYNTPTYLKQGFFNILYPHWGYELYLYPNKKYFNIAQEYIQQFDAILGHHAHVPQPIVYEQINDTKKLLAYSLGDFSYGDEEKTNLYHYKYGMIVKIAIGPDSEGNMKIGKVEWQFLESQKCSEDAFQVELTSHIPKLNLGIENGI